MEIKLLGYIKKYNPEIDEITIKLSFTGSDKQAMIEQLFKESDDIAFSFSHSFRKSKTYKQLKMYFRLLKQILIKQEVPPTSDNVKALDEYIKKSLLECKYLEVGGKNIPIVPSKADLSLEKMSELIERIMDIYDIENEGE